MRKLLVSVASSGVLAAMAVPALAADKDNDKLVPLGDNFADTVGPQTENEDAVRIIEKRLGRKANGEWGEELTRALERFQERRGGLEKTGEVDRRTLAALRGRSGDDLPPHGPLTDLQATWLGLDPIPEPAAQAPATDEVATPAEEAPASTPTEGTGAPSGHLGSIAQCESGGDYGAVDPSGTYHGAYQFDQSTWESVGGSGSPSAASPAEQDKRAQMLLQRSGTSPWPNCG